MEKKQKKTGTSSPRTKKTPISSSKTVKTDPKLTELENTIQILKAEMEQLVQERDSLKERCEELTVFKEKTLADSQKKQASSRKKAAKDLAGSCPRCNMFRQKIEKISAQAEKIPIYELDMEKLRNAVDFQKAKVRKLTEVINSLRGELDNSLTSVGLMPDWPADKVAPDSPDESILISIVLPVYNHASLVHESIDSILAQTYRNWELIIVNDGSEDNLAEVVKPYLSDKRIHYLEQSNQKLPKALSNGFCFARGELLTWTSADNNMHPQMLSKLAAFLRSHGNFTMVYADYSVIDDQGAPFRETWFRPQNKRQPDSADLHLPHSTERLNVVQDNFIGACFMYRKSTRQLFGEYDPQLGVEDYDYWMRINSMMAISHLGTDDLLYYYRVHANSLNGKAQEFKIYDKCAQLMEYEQQRSVFYFKPFEVYSTYKQTDLYFGEFSCNFHEGKSPSLTLPKPFDKKILLCRGSELDSFTPEELECYNFIGAFFDNGTANEVCKHAWRIRRYRIHCFAYPGSLELQRIRVLTDNYLGCYPPEIGFFAMIASNNRMFYEATRPAEERARVLPTIPGCGEGKIIVLLDAIGNGGMEQVAYDMARSFARQGRSVQLVSFQKPGKGVLLPEHLKLHVLNAKDPDKAFKNLLSSEKHAAVFAHYCTRGAQAAHELQIPFFQIVHNSYSWFGEPELKQYIDADPYTAAYIAVSSSVAWFAMEYMHLSPEKMIIIENSVELDRFTPSRKARNKVRKELGIANDNFLFLNPASFYGTKGQMNLVQAFAKAYQRNPKLRLLIAGKILEPEYYKNVRKIITENNLEDAVITGKFFVDMAEVYSAADAVVFASFWEGCSLAAAEAIHMKKTLLSPRVGDIERQTDCKNCILFDLPFRYLPELNGTNYGEVVYTPNQHMIDALENGMIDIAAGNHNRKTTRLPDEKTADEVYQRYLKVLNYYAGDFAPEIFRHNI